MAQDKQLTIRSSTAEILIFEQQAQGEGIEVRYEDETLWITQKMMAALFDVSIPTINEHLKSVFESGELERTATIRKFRIVQQEGARQVDRDVEHYDLDAIISVGYRVNSVLATQFRRWATQVLKKFAVTGYVLDRKRMENGAFLGKDSLNTCWRRSGKSVSASGVSIRKLPTCMRLQSTMTKAPR